MKSAAQVLKRNTPSNYFLVVCLFPDYSFAFTTISSVHNMVVTKQSTRCSIRTNWAIRAQFSAFSSLKSSWEKTKQRQQWEYQAGRGVSTLRSSGQLTMQVTARWEQHPRDWAIANLEMRWCGQDFCFCCFGPRSSSCSTSYPGRLLAYQGWTIDCSQLSI